MNRVVITGLGIVSPIGNSIENYWSGLINGRCGVDYISKFSTKHTDYKIAAEVKDFQADDFLSKAELKSTDLYSQFAIFAALQALRDSKIKGNIQPNRFGVYFGSGLGGISTVDTEFMHMIEQGTRRVSPYLIPKIIANSAAGLIAIHCEAKGPCIPIVTACATASHSIGEAYKTITHGYADAIIAGGSDAGINPLILAGFSNCGALSLKQNPYQASIPFDKRRDGFIMGEGAGALILENYESAKRRNAKIYAEIIGYGNTCDAYHITAPDPEMTGCFNAICMSLYGLDNYMANDIYINAHGTSTPKNDKYETKVIKNVFGSKAYDISISSTKSMTGHMMGAAGAAEAIATILTLYNGLIPPTVGLYEKDIDCDLNYTPNVAVKKNVKIGLSISMGFGGHNACLTFQKVRKN